MTGGEVPNPVAAQVRRVAWVYSGLSALLGGVAAVLLAFLVATTARGPSPSIQFYAVASFAMVVPVSLSVRWALTARHLIRKSPRLPTALSIMDDRVVAWYAADDRTSSPSSSRTLLYANIIGIAGGDAAFQFDIVTADLVSFNPARVTGYLEPGPGPSEMELALRRSDAEDSESRGRPAGAIYLTKANANIVSRAYQRWSKISAAEGATLASDE